MIASHPKGGHMPSLSMQKIKDFFQTLGRDNLPLLASSIAFSATFSIAPLFIMLIAIVGWVLGLQNGGHGHHIAEGELLAQIQRHAGKKAADTLQSMVSATYNKPKQGIFSVIIGWISIIAGAMALFSSLQGALNSIWQTNTHLNGWKEVVRARLASFVMIVMIGAVLLFFIIFQASIAVVGNFMGFVPPTHMPPLVAVLLNQAISLLVATTIFTLLFKVLPDTNMHWRQVIGGAFITAILYAIGQAAISLYFAAAGVTSAYGAAGSLLAVLLWIYYSALIMLVGAEITKFYNPQSVPNQNAANSPNAAKTNTPASAAK